MDYVEIDVNTSQDGVLYLFHGPELAKTTNGKGVIMEQPAAVIDQLGAGSWIDPKFTQERVPRLNEFLRWIKGKAKLFLDVKWGNLETLVTLIRETGLSRIAFSGSSCRSGDGISAVGAGFAVEGECRDGGGGGNGSFPISGQYY